MDNADVIDLTSGEKVDDHTCLICCKSMTGLRLAHHFGCRNTICKDCFSTINGTEPEEDQVDEPLIKSRPCPICRSHLQWIDPTTQREIPQIYGFLREIHQSTTKITYVRTVNEWNYLCDAFKRPTLKIEYNNAPVLDLTG
jgi:hypothetical protein